MELKNLFDAWGRTASKEYIDRQWLLSKWEVVEGIEWPPEKIQRMIGSIVDGLRLTSRDIVVDLGCGGGWILKELKAYSRRMVGLDFSLPMLENAVAYCPGESFVCGEIGKLPLKENSFDCALSYFVFLNFMDDRFVEQAILDVVRILRKGGRALLGQLPDQTRSGEYDQAKAAYLDYCRGQYQFGKDNRDICRAPQKLFDKARLADFLRSQNIVYRFEKSFNPFYRPGEPERVDWRFDLILEKQ
jgi:SAM-dependent methyltransferase